VLIEWMRKKMKQKTKETKKWAFFAQQREKRPSNNWIRVFLLVVERELALALFGVNPKQQI